MVKGKHTWAKTLKKKIKKEEKYTLLNATNEVIENFNAKVQKGKRSFESLKKWRTTKAKIVAFLQHHFKKQDILLANVKVNFADQFFDFLTLVDGIEDNTSMKYIKNTKQVFKRAVLNGWLASNPIQDFKCKYADPCREGLVMDDIIKIYRKRS